MPLESVSERTPVLAHVCFRLESASPLDLSTEPDAHELWTHLSYRVIRHSGNLLAHSRRVLLCRREELQERLPAALLDLDHAAGGHGHALRCRLLGIVRPCLGSEHAAWFDARLEGSPSLGDVPDGPWRVLPSMSAARRALDIGSATDRP